MFRFEGGKGGDMSDLENDSGDDLGDIENMKIEVKGYTVYSGHNKF